MSITCCAIKGKEIRYFVTNCHLAQLVGLSHEELLVFKSFGVRIRKVLSLFSPFSKFLSSVSFYRVRLSVRLRFRVSVRVRIRVKVKVRFCLSPPIVRELVLSLSWLSFPLVRFRHNHLTVVILLLARLSIIFIGSSALLGRPRCSLSI